MEYYMVTGYGPAPTGLSSSEQAPIYGQGQDATDAPPSWTLVANICQKTYNRYAKGCILRDPT
eukprot:1201362-Ditylum_brightwellii.AAC.1